MGKRRTSQTERPRKCKRTGREARAGRQTLRSEKIGALPIINHFLKRLRLEEWLQEYLPPDDTWKLLCELAGRKDFLYFADSKLATSDNMTYIAGKGGQFITVLPQTRGEDKTFRKALREGKVSWRTV